MRRLTVLLPVLILAGCGRSPGGGDSAAGGPNLSRGAAPGVAFVYAYSYSLPDTRISAVQEAHAAACERLGPARCRITGMRYAVASGDTVTASLAVKLAPEIARQFGKAATDMVAQNDGKLVEAEITGEDAGTKVAAANETGTSAARELADIDGRLRDPKLPPGERQNLLARAVELRGQQGEAQTAERAARATLAATPMTFNYAASKDFVSLRETLATGWSSVVALINVVLMGLAVLGPWVLVAIGLVLLWRRFVPRARPTLFAMTDAEADQP